MSRPFPKVEDMTPEQLERFGAVVDSQVRILGKTYSAAHSAVAYDGAGNADYILGPETKICASCSHPAHADVECEEITGYDHLNGDHNCGCPGGEPS